MPKIEHVNDTINTSLANNQKGSFGSVFLSRPGTKESGATTATLVSRLTDENNQTMLSTEEARQSNPTNNYLKKTDQNYQKTSVERRNDFIEGSSFINYTHSYEIEDDDDDEDDDDLDDYEDEVELNECSQNEPTLNQHSQS